MPKLTLTQDEAIAVYNRLNQDRNNLIEEKRTEQAVQPPFFWHHIRPEVRRRAVIDTWQNARPNTDQRRLFDAGATAGEHAPNWVTLWLLYSVFRSRDVRNNRSRRGESNGGSGELSVGIMSLLTDTSTGHTGGGGESKVYDPARNAYRSR